MAAVNKIKKVVLTDSKAPSLKDLLVQNIEVEIPISIFKEFTHSFDSFVRGYHAYMDVWLPTIGDSNFDVEREQGNSHDEYAIGIFLKGNVVGHAPKCFSKPFAKFLE